VPMGTARQSTNTRSGSRRAIIEMRLTLRIGPWVPLPIRVTKGLVSTVAEQSRVSMHEVRGTFCSSLLPLALKPD
jgi:hypothetical protein